MSPTADDAPIKRAPAVYGRRVAHRPPAHDQPPAHASDSERSPSRFQFGFRQQLKALDDHFDDHDAPASPPSQAKDLSVLSPRSSGDLPRTSPTPLHATSADTPLVRRRPRRLASPVPSDSEAEEPNKSSSVSPVRHAITTPHSRSSPTPPTSGEVPMASKSAKGKAPARDVLPLVFGGEQSSVAELPIKSNKGRRSKSLARPKTKAPTKKEQREATFESSRIAADRPVEVMRTQKQKHSLSTFFAGLQRDNIAIPSLGTELPSDPIERFSSPTDESARVPSSSNLFGAPTGLLGTSALPLAAVDSDGEMPSVTSMIQKTGEQRRLDAIKQTALQRADSRGSDSEDDDLLIVKDDMHTVAREEAVQRRRDKAHGSPAKDITLLRKIKHLGVRPAVVSPRKLSKQELQELAKPSFAHKGKEVQGQLSKKQLDQWMIMQHAECQLKTIKQHEEEWVRRGGTLSRDSNGDGVRTSLSERLGAYAERGLKAVEIDDEVGDEASTESDEDYTPNLRGSASPEPMDEDADASEQEDNMEVSQALQPTDDKEEEYVVPSRRNKSARRHPRLIMGSDDEEEQLVPRNLPAVQRDSTSSMESQTEDENDKENSAKLMYDRSEDKENKAVVRHELSSSELEFGPSPGRLHSTGDGAQSDFSLATATDLNGTTPKGDVRSPLKDISKDEDDPFLSPPSKPPFAERLLRSITISPPRATTSTLSLGSPPTLRSERICKINRLCLDLENDENTPSGLKPLRPSFLERLHSQTSHEPSLALLNPLQNGGLSQLFSAEDETLKKSKSVDGTDNDGLSLTLDVALKPALEVSGTVRRKAESIFEKEQEYVVAAAVQQNDKPKQLIYVDDHGFLTQTRPEGSSPQVYHMTPSQASKFIGTQVHLTQTQPLSARPPLRTLAFTASPELSPEPQLLKRLRRRSASPLEQRTLGQCSNPDVKLNAFSILGKTPKPPSETEKGKLVRSEFVAAEAEESDEDDMFGFGGPKKDDGEEEDGEDQDKVVEGLVDDTVMDVETEAAHLVQEKYREHEEEDDQRLQKLHQDAVEGKFRMKRRDRGVGLEYDSDEDDDDDACRIRQRMHKKRKIEGDSLEALGQNEETRAFYNTYHQDLIDEEDEFAHLRMEVTIPADNGDTRGEDSEEREIVTVDEIRQRVREIAQNNTEETEALDPEDTSWIDHSTMIDVDDAVRVKVVEHRRSKSTACHPNAGQMDFDVERPNQRETSEQQRQQWMTWAKDHRRQPQGTGRSGNSAAVTGHSKAKTGGGSLRSTQPSNTAVGETRKIKNAMSMLSTVSSRSGRFS